MKIIDAIPPELLDAMNNFSRNLEWARRLPVYEIHKWWARRYSGVIRLLLAFSELEKKSLDKISDFHAFVREVYFHPPKVKGKKLLDPFCGGGTIVIEGAKLGYEAYGIEINKLPYLTLCALKELPRLDLKIIENKIVQASNFVKDIWTTKCNKGHTAQVIHTFLAWEDKKGRLQIKFNKLKESRRDKVYFCEKCKKVYTHKLDLKKCVFCDNQFDKDYEKIEYKNLVPYAIEYFCSLCNERKFKTVSHEDKEKFDIKSVFKNRHLLEIPCLNETARLLRVGLRYFDQLLTPRQQLSFQRFLNSFKKKSYSTIAKLLVSDSLRSCSLLAYYSTKYNKVIPGFIIKSYWLPPQPVELNPLSFRISNGNLIPLGRGNIVSSFRKFKRAKEFIKYQQIPLNFKIYHGPAQEIIPKLNCTFDLVFTDPPYGDYQFYSDLSLFSLSITREINSNSLKKLLEKEVTLRKGKDLIKYKEGLYQVFSSVTSKLSKKSRIIMTFHHPNIDILYEVLGVFKTLSLKLHAIYPVIGESSGQLVKRRIYLDLVFLFGKEKKEPYYALTSFSFTQHDDQLQKSIEKLIQFYEA